jgi:hypothetical protein
MISTAAELVGLILIVVAAFLLTRWLGYLVAGAELVFVGYVLSAKPAPGSGES